ncbi:hypothetical protein J7K19_05695 [bacterium]|nr:hypothetical protein [bacterium]
MRRWTAEEISLLKEERYHALKYAEMFNRSIKAVQMKAERLRLHLPREDSYYIDRTRLKKWSEELAYITGLWFADGNICGNRIAFHSIDLDILKEIKNFLRTKAPISYRKSLSTKLYVLRFADFAMARFLRSLGGIERKSYVDLNFPDIPQTYSRHFIRGFFEGDGNLSWAKTKEGWKYPRIFFFGQLSFLSGLNKYLPIKGKVNWSKAISLYYISFSNSKAKAVLDFMYQDSSFSINRKYEKYLETQDWEPKFLWLKPSERRLIIKLKEEENKSFSEIAKYLNRKPECVRSSYYHWRERIAR